MNSSLSRRWLLGCQVLLGAGVVAFVTALAAGQGQRAWQAYLLNFLFWTGIAQCGVVFSAAYRITRGGWSDAFRRMGESLSFFLPVSFALFLVLMLFGASSVFPWTHEPYPGRERWLTVPAVALRDSAVFLVVFGLSLAYVFFSERTAARTALSLGMLRRSRVVAFWTRGAATTENALRSEARARALAPALVVAFVVGFSLVAFDLVMSLERGWSNTMLGCYFAVGSFYAMLALLALAAALFRRNWGLETHLKPDQVHDLGRLLFGFCLLTGGLFWAQWLVFWYGNLPEEIAWVIPRFYRMPFGPLGWVAAYGAFLVPMVLLLSKSLKRRPRALMAVAAWILLALWLERYLWIVPSGWRGGGAPFVIEALVSAGFLGGFLWGWLKHLERFPISALAGLPPPRIH